MKVVGLAVALYGTFTANPIAKAAGVALMSAGSYLDARKARRRARDAYNASLQDRMQMVDVQPDAPRTLVLGRVRAVEGVRRRWTSGTNDEKLTLVVSFAGHEIDAFEAFYFDDIELTLDGSGYVLTEPYLKTTHVSMVEQGLLDGSGAASVTLAASPIAGTVTAIYRDGTGDTGSLTVGGSGTSITLSGGVAGAEYWVNYQTAQGASRARVRGYLGTAAQNVGAALAAEYPGKITSADKFAGIALAVVDLEYDPDVFPQGVPRITARMRGAKVLDPRTSTTAWSENPALLAYHYVRHANGWALPVDEIRTADIEAAADVCDVSTDFTLRKSPTVTEVVTLARYRCGIVIPTDGDPRAAMDDIFEAMAGRWGWAGGTWRMRAGHMATPVWDMQPQWVAQRLGPDGLPADGNPVVQWSSGVPRENKVNRVAGRCVDPDQRWQLLPFPAVEDAVLIAAEGAEYAVEVDYAGVNHVAHAQHLGTVRIRQAQASLRGDVQCNLSAYPVELFDVGEATLPRYGMAAKTFECTGWRWHPAEGVSLALEEITADIFTPVAELTGRDPAPNSSLPAPWSVETVTGVVVTSGTVPLTDASVITRTQVAWDAVVSEAVRVGGHIEVQYLQADATLPDGDWPSWQEQGSATVAIIPGLLAEAWYIFRVRAVSALGVRGAWSAQVRHQVAAPPAISGVSLLTLQSTGFAYVFDDEAATTSTSPDITFTAELVNVSGTVTFSGTAYDAAGAVVGTAGDVTFTSVTATTAVLTVANFTRGGTTVRYVKVTATLGALSDTTTVYRGDGGSDAVQARLTNEAHTLPADDAGTVTSYTGAGGTMQVYKGTTLLSNVTTPSVSFALAPSGNPQGLTYSINATSGVYSVTAMPGGVDVATLTIRATLSTGETRDAVFSLSKSKAGVDGVTGVQTAIVYAYRRATGGAPSGPSVSATYTFSTKSLTALNNSWTTTVPAGTDPLYVIAATASADADVDTDVITSGEWSGASQISGNDGAAGLNSATVFLYQRTASATAPSLPGSTLTYTFATGVLSGTLGSWSQTVPSGSGAYVHVTTATAASTGATDSITSGEWAAVRVLAQNGVDGTSGTDGARGSLHGYAYGQYGISNSSWSDGHANRTINNMLTGASLTTSLATTSHLRIGDQVSESNGSSWSETRFWSGSAWLLPGTVISGNLLVGGTITGSINLSIAGTAIFDGVNSALTVQTATGSASKTMAVRANYATASAAMGIFSKSTAADGFGTYSEATGTNGVGMFGYGATGVFGKATSGGVGVAGYATGSGSNGVYGKTDGNSENGGFFETGGVGGGSSNTALRAKANNSAHTALAVEGVMTTTGRITSTLSGVNVPLVLPVVTSKPTAITGGICLHNTLGLIVSDGTNWFGPSGGLVAV